MVIIEKHGSFHLRGYSKVSFQDGTPKPTAVQQTVALARKSDECPSKGHWRVLELSAAKQRQIAEWEKTSGVATEPEAPNSDITVTMFYETIFLPWLSELVKTGQKSHSTLVSYQRYWNTYLAGHFNGTKTFKNYRPYIGQQFLDNLRKDDGTPYGEATMKHIHSTASGIFARAIRTGYAGETDEKDEKKLQALNPWHSISVSDAPQISAEQGEAFTESEVEKMIANLEGDRDGRSNWNVQLAQTVLAVGIWAGLRPSEIAALQWQSVNLDNATLTICRAYVYGREKPRTKTNKDRIVHFRDKLTPILKAWWATNDKPTSDWVFPNRDANPVNMNTLSDRIIGPNCEKHGMKWSGMSFYALRRGCATLLVLDDWTLEEVAGFLGNTPEVTYKNYFVKKEENKLAAAARERSRAKAGVGQ